MSLKQNALTGQKREGSAEIIGFKTSVCRMRTGSFSYILKDVEMDDCVKGCGWERDTNRNQQVVGKRKGVSGYSPSVSPARAAACSWAPPCRPTARSGGPPRFCWAAPSMPRCQHVLCNCVPWTLPAGSSGHKVGSRKSPSNNKGQDLGGKHPDFLVSWQDSQLWDVSCCTSKVPSWTEVVAHGGNLLSNPPSLSCSTFLTSLPPSHVSWDHFPNKLLAPHSFFRVCFAEAQTKTHAAWMSG